MCNKCLKGTDHSTNSGPASQIIGSRWSLLPLSKPSERSERGLGSEENCVRLLLIDSEMAGPIKLKLGGMVEGMGENVLAKEFFGSVEVDRGRVGGQQVPLLHHGNEIKSPN